MFKKINPMMFDKHIYITLTEKCNWQCKYCDFPKLETKNTAKNIDNFLNYAKKIIPKNTMVTWEGGEIGLVDESLLDKVFYSDISETYSVITNGAFLKNKYHEKYKNKIH